MTLLDNTHSQRRKLPIVSLLPVVLIVLLIALIWFFASSDVEISQQQVSTDISYQDLTASGQE